MRLGLSLLSNPFSAKILVSKFISRNLQINQNVRILQSENSCTTMIKINLQKNVWRGFLLVLVMTCYACGGRYNTIEQEDPHEGDPYVYGEIGGPPRQTANQYEPDPKADARAQAIREKLFGPARPATPGNDPYAGPSSDNMQ